MFFRKPKSLEASLPKRSPSFLKGFVLAVLNPPVLVFWLVAFAYISSFISILDLMAALQLVVVFFAGVFLGKIFTLWLYVQLSKRIANKANGVKEKITAIIGILLLVIGSIQLVKLLVG